jgi:hypothetical protein
VTGVRICYENSNPGGLLPRSRPRQQAERFELVWFRGAGPVRFVPCFPCPILGLSPDTPYLQDLVGPFAGVLEAVGIDPPSTTRADASRSCPNFC